MNNIITNPSAQAAGDSFVAPVKKKIGDRRIVPIGQPPNMAQNTPSSATGLMSSPMQTYTPEKGVVQDNQLVEKRVDGLMSMDNPLMKKSVVNANNMSARRGLQSSSIATENGVNAMFANALPIAQQDAQTYKDQSFLNQSKSQEAGIEGMRAGNAMTLQRDAQQFQSGLEDQKTANQLNINRDTQNFQTGLEDQRMSNALTINRDAQQFQSKLQKDLEDLRYQNSRGMLDAQAQVRLTELETQNEHALQQITRNEAVQTKRDTLLQSFQETNINLDTLSAIQKIEAQALASIELQTNQNQFARAMEYSNAVSDAVNRSIESLGNLYTNPEIDPDQYSSIEASLRAMVADQIGDFKDIYGIGSTPTPTPTPPDGNGDGYTPPVWFNPDEYYPPPEPVRPVRPVRPVTPPPYTPDGDR